MKHCRKLHCSKLRQASFFFSTATCLGGLLFPLPSLPFQILILWRGFSAVPVVLLLAVRQCMHQSHQEARPWAVRQGHCVMGLTVWASHRLINETGSGFLHCDKGAICHQLPYRDSTKFTRRFCCVCLSETLRCFMSSQQKCFFFFSVHPLINAFIVQENSSHGSLDNVRPHFFPICLHSSTFNLVLKRVVNVGWYYWGWWPCRAFWGLQHNQWEQISLHSIGSGNDYLELTQIKDRFLLSQQDQSKEAAPFWLPAETLE